jgi:hypothetical protein
MSLRQWYPFAYILPGLFLYHTPASTADLNYVTGGSLNLAHGTSAIQYRRGSSADHAFYLTFGGPSIKLSFPDIDFTITASFFPSLRFVTNLDPGINRVSTMLGFGPSFGYKNWILSMPLYFPNSSKTDIAIGIGYRL